MSNSVSKISQYIWDHYIEFIISSIVAIISFIASYFWGLVLKDYEQFIAVISVVFIDGVFGMIKGHKTEGFITNKAIKVLRTATVWVGILAVLLAIEHGFQGSGWLSETIMIPFLIFQIISTLKNASLAGYIKADLLNEILDKIDKHKGERKS